MTSTFLDSIAIKRSTGLIITVLCASSVLAQNVTINEVLASNASLDYDDFFEYEDWVELYNAGGILDLAGYHLTDDADSLGKWMFPMDDPGLTTILPGGHIRIWCDKDEQQGSDHANFKLSGEGETIYFVDIDGQTILDSLIYGLQQDDISFGAACDGCDEWQYFNTPTPDATNEETALTPSVLFINEIQSNNTSTIGDETGDFDAWVELFNPNDYQVNLNGYSFEFNGSTHTFQNTEPWLTTIPANGFQIFWFDNQIDQGSNHISLAPMQSGSLTLLGNDGNAIDAAEWDANLTEDTSYGRESDGSPNWMAFEFPTARASNTLQIILPGTLVINEIQSDNFITYPDNADEYDDWIEIYNYGNNPVDISNYFLSDRLDQPQKWLIPSCNCDSTVINPNGFLIIFADEDGGQGWNHANFKVSSSGEPIALRSPDGFTIADAVEVPALGLGKSWGRDFDAGSPWIEFQIPTPNASNGDANPVSMISGQQPFADPYPNPVGYGESMKVSTGGRMLNSAGFVIKQWNTSGSVLFDQAPGLYIIHWETSQGQRTSTSKILGIK
ncbi:MAG: hypothetical protein CL834_08425 [Crocinitomicaceae bacterium]|nr:hypothetical protein [Crocinitomicaceae bacterium]